ncbi:hypothetical protein E1287_21965 [Actinomadura sp. KC06]|uniref:hypothetical protein n=1 Tax=Actinomadura sp. KC06 TaxID=2530369 RepID=UPI001045EEDA|nr:hypothetical protein [Actinomadura sp. KC06]TDD32669.1 hypothetical protein E1287_21965 [Actinomadura sp. KC06]
MIRNSRRMGALAVAGAVAIAPVISGCGAGEEPQSAAPTQLTDGVNVSVPLDKPAEPQIALRNVFVLGPRPGQPIAPGSSLALYGVMINQVKERQDRLVSVSSPLFDSPAKIDGGGLVLPAAAPDGMGSPVKLLGKPSKPSTPPAAPPAGNQTKRPGTTPSGQPQDGATPRGDATPQPTRGGATPEPTGAGATPEPTGAGATPQPNTGPAQQNAPQATTPSGEQPLVVLTGLKQELLASSRVPVQMQFEKAGAVQFQVPIVPQQGEYMTYPLAGPAGQAPGSPNPGGTQPSAPAQPGSPGHGSPQPGATQPPAGGGASPGGSGH